MFQRFLKRRKFIKYQNLKKRQQQSLAAGSLEKKRTLMMLISFIMKMMI